MNAHEQAQKATQSVEMAVGDLRSMFGHVDEMAYFVLDELTAEAVRLQRRLSQFASALKDKTGDKRNG